MRKETDSRGVPKDLRCPTCRAALKRRRSRNADACEMVCGGCGEVFDVCDPHTVAQLKPQ